MSSSSDPFNREIRLRVEAESPFRKVRFFLYASGLAGAFTSFALSAARVAAGLAGVNTDLLQESAVNAGIDAVGIILLAFLYKRDLDAQESRLKRAAKGAQFSKLMVRGSNTLLGGDGMAAVTVSGGKTSVTPLSSLRQGRGVEKRVVIAAAGKDKMKEVLEEIRNNLGDLIIENDLVIVPVVMPQCTAPLGFEEDLIEQECVALPAGGDWAAVVEDEAATAREQGVDVEKEGLCVIVKKNGKVGQRTRGIFLGRMCGDVAERRELGMDVTNI